MLRIKRYAPIAAVYLLLLATPVEAVAQDDLEHAAGIEEQIHESIASEQTAHGAHSTALIPLFTELGHLYRELGHEQRAAAAFEEARGVVRANHGFSSLDEAPLLAELIRIEEGLGEAQEAWDREHELLALARAHPEDVRAADIYREMGDKRLDLLNRYLAGEFPPQLALGCYYHSSLSPADLIWVDHNCSSGSRSELIDGVMTEAWRYWSAAIKTLADHRLYSSPELRDLEMRIVRSSYALGAYSVGRRSLVRLLAYDAASDVPSLAQVDSLLQLADWDIVSRVFSDSELDTYEQAYAKLRRDGVDAKSMHALFAPDVPIVLPTFQPNPLMSSWTPDSTGHIDVAFEVTSYGRAKHVKILDSTTNASREAERALVQQIERSVFRPRLVDGQVADAAPVVLRYYVAGAEGRVEPERLAPALR